MSSILPASVFTVTRLNQTVRQLLEREMGQVWISGEISNFSRPASGHWYFTLKDDGAQVRCAMFRNSNRRITFRPEQGQQVLIRANITLYEPRGDYQIIAKACSPQAMACCNSSSSCSSKSLMTRGCSTRRSNRHCQLRHTGLGW
jgi:exodeoxyribonuclease VII large subunit